VGEEVLARNREGADNGGMAMGRRKQRQEEFWVATADLPRLAGHPFYERLNELLEEAGFDAFVEERCRKFYAPRRGRPRLAPGMYFRLLLIGYFEGLDSERGMAWRAADSLGLRRFLRVDYSAPSRREPRTTVCAFPLARCGASACAKAFSTLV